MTAATPAKPSDQAATGGVKPAEPEKVPPEALSRIVLVTGSSDAASEPRKEDVSSSNDGAPWFGLWSSRIQPSGAAADETLGDPAKDPAKKNKAQETISQGQPQAPEMTMADGTPKPPSLDTVTLPTRSSTWAFWSKDKPQAPSEGSAGDENTGHVAVAGTASQSQPQPATAKEAAVKPGKRGRPPSLERADDTPGKPGPSTSATPSHSPVRQGGKLSAAGVKQQLQKLVPANLLLPSFHSTYRLMEQPTIMQQLARLLQYYKQEPTTHVSLVKEPPRVKRALAIGVHGYFPAPLIRTVLGQPTGTSIRFANAAAEAIRKWTEKRGYQCDIEKVALEGEGKIAERVDTLWKLMLNWIDKIQKADFVLVACHSQGVPVAVMLVAKLIEFGCISTARIGVCAMAGVNLGPFPDYKSRLFSGSAGELFEFSDAGSAVSRRYEDALRVAVKQGVRIVYVGSIDDQLVSLEVGGTREIRDGG